MALSVVKDKDDPVKETLDIIRRATHSRKILDAAGALACYARALEGLIAKLDHRAAVKIMEKGEPSAVKI